ncbi:adenylate kinase [Candidatus Woesearchaeota archaeon]|nr:adenylate kinase [Candidatus Woesearchaeota archaeon]
MILILLGPPGSGKGTQARMLMDQYKIPQISTGDILRKEIAAGSKLGKEAKVLMNQGKLVPDSTIMSIIEQRIVQPDCKQGFIFDGFPRTIAQAESLGKLLKKKNLQLTRVLNFMVRDSVVVQRIAGRRTCLKCHAIFHVVANPPKQANLCNSCSSSLVQRDDEKEDVVRQRLQEYQQKTAPLIAYYRQQKLLSDIDAEQAIPTIANQLVLLLRR